MLIVQDVIEPLYRQRANRRYRIVASRKRASYCAALAGTYGVEEHTLTNVRACVNQISKLWVDRLWELGRHELWLYQRQLLPDPHEINPDKLMRAFRLYADCRCRCVAYMPPRTKQEKYIEEHRIPCNRANFCPHCWAMTSARQCQRVRMLINEHITGAPNARVTLTSQTQEYFFSAAGIGGVSFSNPAERHSAISALVAEIDRCKSFVKQKHKTVQRKTLASIWRYVVIPADDGWRIQVRQLFLTDGFSSPPQHIMRRTQHVRTKSAVASSGHTWQQRKSTLTMDEDIYACLIDFNRYPVELLTGDIELVGIYLNAAAKTRMLGGTGKLHRIGRALVREYVQKEAAIKHAKAG